MIFRKELNLGKVQYYICKESCTIGAIMNDGTTVFFID